MAETRLDQPRGVRRTGPHYDAEAFGRFAETIARFIGTARFLVLQTIIVIGWIAWNVVVPASWRFDEYPFIFLTLALSLQAAYAAPLILLAQTRQADRDKAAADDLARIADAQRRHVEEQTGGLRDLLQTNTALTRRIAALTSEIHIAACGRPAPPLGDDDASPPSHRPVSGA